MPGLPNTGAGAAADPLVIQLKTQNNSGQSGTATLTDMGGGKTKVVVDLAGSPAGPQPMHIHTGTCSNLGPVKYPLTSLANGKSETTVDVSMADLLASPHAINAHKSTTEAAVYVACGEVVGQTPTAAPRTGGGALTARSSQLPAIVLAALLTLMVAGTTVILRRRQA